jgi:hypothetical protein
VAGKDGRRAVRMVASGSAVGGSGNKLTAVLPVEHC